MDRDPRYEILFEPVQIGPVSAKNRFYQVPHCNGMGFLRPDALAAMRGVKAEGGWAVVCTEETGLHPTTDFGSWAGGRLWDDGDIPGIARMADAVHAHGALAGIQAAHNGFWANNALSRLPPMAPSGISSNFYYPVQARAMDRSDIRAFRRWHREAALRAKQADFDIVYVYAAHDLSLPMHFLSRRYNQRTDEYGGSLENRVRLLRELIEDTKEAVGDRCGVVVRLAVEELLGPDGITHQGEGRDVVEMLAELPDLWDVNIGDWSIDSGTSRFVQEGFQDEYISFVKSVTSKPVVGVGRYTTPDKMVALVRSGVLDMIGAARPSIADPFLPKKIEEGRVDEIRECIGCNICVAADQMTVPIRCTQNPTMGEEWRRGWHPERIEAKKSDDAVLVVGAGPAGLEAARALGDRGYAVTLAEASRELGGRVFRESQLPGLSEWGRVRDYRIAQIDKLSHVEIFRESRIGPEEVSEFGAPHVLIATGSRWRRDGMGRQHRAPIPGLEHGRIYTPDDLMAGDLPTGKVVVFDDDHYYMGGVIAELLRARGCEVVLVTPAADVSTWTHQTLEQAHIQARLLAAGIEIATSQDLVTIHSGEVEIGCVFSDRRSRLACDAVALVTERVPEDGLYQALRAGTAGEKLRTLRRVGDCLTPGHIAQAVWDGHRAARELEGESGDEVFFKREYTALEKR
jgi:dimethylamine/trimethylamine dehydrogenase